MMMSGGRVLLLGLGDLGSRLAHGLGRRSEITTLILAGQTARTGAPLAHMVAACGQAVTDFVAYDALDAGNIAALVERYEPDLIVQCASLLSPWLLANRRDDRASAVRTAGFAIQLAAQLPAALTLMRAARQARFDRPVVNCSYPDVTHPILHRLGLAPTVGIGNVGMIQALIAARLRRQGRATVVRALAHHAHVTAVITSDPVRLGVGPHPRVFLGEEGAPADELAYENAPLPSTRELNALSAAHGVDVIASLLPGARPLRICAPGPLGLPGGWPVHVADGSVRLDLPRQVTATTALRFQEQAAVLDGVEAISEDGTVYYTEGARRAVGGSMAMLAEPLKPNDALPRYAALRKWLAGDS